MARPQCDTPFVSSYVHKVKMTTSKVQEEWAPKVITLTLVCKDKFSTKAIKGTNQCWLVIDIYFFKTTRGDWGGVFINRKLSASHVINIDIKKWLSIRLSI